MPVFNIGIAMIFAREFLEAAVIITQYHTLVNHSTLTIEERAISNKIIKKWSAGAIMAAIVIIALIGLALEAAGSSLSANTKRGVEGFSKLIAAICIAQLSTKIPKWLGLYGESKKMASDDLLAPGSLKFNIFWNLWREMAEIGVFLIPFLVGGKIEEVPLSAIAGILIAAVLGFLLHIANSRMGKKPLAIFMSVLTGWLAVGLFAGGCHEFEEVINETDVVYRWSGNFWNQKEFPMALFKPFGYSDHPTQLQIAAFWLFAFFLVLAHAIKYWRAKDTVMTHIEMDDDTDTITT